MLKKSLPDVNNIPNGPSAQFILVIIESHSRNCNQQTLFEPLNILKLSAKHAFAPVLEQCESKKRW